MSVLFSTVCPTYAQLTQWLATRPKRMNEPDQSLPQKLKIIYLSRTHGSPCLCLLTLSPYHDDCLSLPLSAETSHLFQPSFSAQDLGSFSFHRGNESSLCFPLALTPSYPSSALPPPLVAGPPPVSWTLASCSLRTSTCRSSPCLPINSPSSSLLDPDDLSQL